MQDKHSLIDNVAVLSFWTGCRFISRLSTRPLCWRRHSTVDRGIFNDEQTSESAEHHAWSRQWAARISDPPLNGSEWGAGTCGAWKNPPTEVGQSRGASSCQMKADRWFFPSPGVSHEVSMFIMVIRTVLLTCAFFFQAYNVATPHSRHV